MSRATRRADPQPATCRGARAHFARDLQRPPKGAWADTRPSRGDVTVNDLGCRLGHERPHRVTQETDPLRLLAAGNMPAPSHDDLAAGGSAAGALDHRRGRKHGVAPK